MCECGGYNGTETGYPSSTSVSHCYRNHNNTPYYRLPALHIISNEGAVKYNALSIAVRKVNKILLFLISIGIGTGMGTGNGTGPSARAV
jgi:hypothetical protein